MEYAVMVIIFMPQAIYQQQTHNVGKQWHRDILRQLSAALLMPSAFAPKYQTSWWYQEISFAKYQSVL